MRYTLLLPVGRLLCVTATLAFASAASAQQKAAIPDASAQQAAKKTAADIYGSRFRQADSSAEKVALAKEIIAAAGKVRGGSADQYALLEIGRDIAAGAGDVETALKAVESLADRFDVPHARLEAEALLTAQNKAGPLDQHKAVAEAAVRVLDALVANDDYELAHKLCDAASESARRAREYPLLKQFVLRGESLRQSESAHAEYEKALAALDRNPTDPEANLTVGRYLCFVKGNWDAGGAMLALGSDEQLKAAARRDIQEPTAAADQVAVGDAWWDLAQDRPDQEKESLRRRAGSWYRQALLSLPAGLSRVKVESRLAEFGNDLPPALASKPRSGATDWDPTTLQPARRMKGHQAEVRDIAFSPDGSLLASGSSDSHVKIWDLATGKVRQTLDAGGSEYVQAVAFSPRGTQLAVGKTDKKVLLYDLATGTATPLNGPRDRVAGLCFNADGSLLASAGWDRTARLWQVDTRQALQTLSCPARMESVALSPDGSLLACVGETKSVLVWDTKAGKLLHTLEGHEGGVKCVAFSRNGTTVASGGTDDSIRLWDAKAGRRLATLFGHEGDVLDLAFSPDGKFFASASSDGSVGVWEVDSGRLLNRLRGHSRRVLCVAFSPDGRTIASGGGLDRTVVLWQPPSKAR